MDRARLLLRSLLVSALLTAVYPGSNAHADDPKPPRAAPRAATLLTTAETATSTEAWWREHLGLRRTGIEYRDSFTWGERSLGLRVSGPVVKGSPGLRLELRGLRIRGYAVRVRAIGAARKQHLEFELRF